MPFPVSDDSSIFRSRLFLYLPINAIIPSLAKKKDDECEGGQCLSNYRVFNTHQSKMIKDQEKSPCLVFPLLMIATAVLSPTLAGESRIYWDLLVNRVLSSQFPLPLRLNTKNS